jgi:hypothetical protein
VEKDVRKKRCTSKTLERRGGDGDGSIQTISPPTEENGKVVGKGGK